MKKKLLIVLLIATMMVTFMPTMAFAATKDANVAMKGIHLKDKAKLKVYGQEKQRGRLYAASSNNQPAIGGSKVKDSMIAIYGGIIDANGKNNCPGIGFVDSTKSTVKVFGGNIKAKGNPGIGFVKSEESELKINNDTAEINETADIISDNEEANTLVSLETAPEKKEVAAPEKVGPATPEKVGPAPPAAPPVEKPAEVNKVIIHGGSVYAYGYYGAPGIQADKIEIDKALKAYNISNNFSWKEIKDYVNADGNYPAVAVILSGESRS